MTAAGRGRPSGALSPGTRRPVESPHPDGVIPINSRRTPLLLQGQDYFYRATDNCLDFQERVHSLGMVDDPADGRPQPCVLVLARAADMEMNELSLALGERGIRMARIDADRCLDLPLTVYHDEPLVELDRFLLRPVMVWRRHFDLTAVPTDTRTVYGAYAVDQWTAIAAWLAGREDWAQVNSARHTSRLDRLTQLTEAKAVGLRIPRTAVSTQPGRTRPGGGSCVVKSAGHHLLEPRPGALHGVFPRPLDTARAGDSPEPAPVIIQQYFSASHELRVFVVGDRLFAYRVEKLDPAQLWVDPEAVVVRRTELDPRLAGQLTELADRWHLQVAAFDLLVVDGDHVFLEVNVNCDWRWFEHRAGVNDVSTAVHQWVASRFRELCRVPGGQGR